VINHCTYSIAVINQYQYLQTGGELRANCKEGVVSCNYDRVRDTGEHTIGICSAVDDHLRLVGVACGGGVRVQWMMGGYSGRREGTLDDGRGEEGEQQEEAQQQQQQEEVEVAEEEEEQEEEEHTTYSALHTAHYLVSSPRSASRA
jgi:hypothetical protein